jgi:hypothetical protein
MADIRKSDTVSNDTKLPKGAWLDTYKSEEMLQQELEFSDELDEEKESTSESDSEVLQQHFLDIEKTTRRTSLVAMMVVLMGTAAAAIFLYTGISSEKSNVKELFDRRASDMAKEITGAWDDYEAMGSWIHSGKYMTSTIASSQKVMGTVLIF